MSLLQIDELRAGYGRALVLRGLSLTVAEGEVLALLGRNGTGKTTLVDTIAGVTTRMGGTIRLNGRDVTTLAPEKRAALGIGWVPQERNVFRSLSVEENLTAVARPGAWDVARAFAMFPRLRERRTNLGSQLSGGEQQMLAVARALVLNPSLLLLDEPLEGLAPIIVDELLAALKQITRNEGMAAIIVEQKARKILPLAHRVVFLDRGTIVHSGTSEAVLADDGVLERHLSVA